MGTWIKWKQHVPSRDNLFSALDKYYYVGLGLMWSGPLLFQQKQEIKNFCVIFPILSTISNKMPIHVSPNPESESWMWLQAASLQLLIEAEVHKLWESKSRVRQKLCSSQDIISAVNTGAWDFEAPIFSGIACVLVTEQLIAKNLRLIGLSRFLWKLPGLLGNSGGER